MANVTARIPARAASDFEIKPVALRLYYEGGCFQVPAGDLPPEVLAWMNAQIKSRLEAPEQREIERA